MARPRLSWNLWNVAAVVDENTKSNIMIFVFSPLVDGQHSARYQDQRYTVMCKDVIGKTKNYD